MVLEDNQYSEDFKVEGRNLRYEPGKKPDPGIKNLTLRLTDSDDKIFFSSESVSQNVKKEKIFYAVIDIKEETTFG